jgi:SAM-dependent methyltransferase/tetratricopeptide (TPR) repeat protein
MNIENRRVAFALAETSADTAAAEIASLLAQAAMAYQQRRFADAQTLCKQILTQSPRHAGAQNLLGVLYQAAGHHRLAVTVFGEALAANECDAVCHYNIGRSHQLLDERRAAACHFKRAIALGLGNAHAETIILQNPTVHNAVRRVMETVSPGESHQFLSVGEIIAIANDVFISSALELTLMRGLGLETLLTHMRAALLVLVQSYGFDSGRFGDGIPALLCAIAQQCFINEYVYSQSDHETAQASRLRDMLAQKLAAGEGVPPLLLAAVAAYVPLHTIPGVQSLLAADWSDAVAALLRQQVCEPLEELQDRRTIRVLTPVDDTVSLEVMRQYEENPYPRWTAAPLTASAAKDKEYRGANDNAQAGPATTDILIAGCGTGRHPIGAARAYPQARIVAADISRTSLAYALRKTREEGLSNIDYVQADILKLGAIGMRFDRVEACGVLHHLADPRAGWRALLSLLRPSGVMRVGLYSEAARRSVVEARRIIAARGYRSSPEDIRALRQSIMRERHAPLWRDMLEKSEDFYSTSGCRDLFFNVMEHRFTIAEIADFLREHALEFHGFEVDAATSAKFAQHYPAAGAVLDLRCWADFEAANPDTFRAMYIFSVGRKRAVSHAA